MTRCLLILLTLCGSYGCASAGAELLGQNVVLVTLDGVRWQELFGGADEALMGRAQGVTDEAGLRQAFWRDTPQARREAMMPFLWSVVAKEGQVFGDAYQGGEAVVTNGKNFSYPGYQEMLAGFPDPAVDSNDKKPNANLTVLGWLNGRPGFQGRVAAYCTWDVFPYILNNGRDGFYTHSGWDPIRDEPLTPTEARLNQVMADTVHYWPGNIFDSFTFHAALEYLGKRKPRVLYLAFGETDEWAHERQYDLYLEAAWRSDQMIRRLWETLQSMEEYRGRTSLVITTDHGRGDTARDWTDHGEKVPGAQRIWIAVMGPRTPAKGSRLDVAVTQSQIAATVAGLVGEDFNAASPRSAPPIPGVVHEQGP